MADSVTPTTVGRIITARRIDAVSIVFPFLPVSCAINGTITTSPKNPYTIDGIPAIRLIPDLQMP